MSELLLRVSIEIATVVAVLRCLWVFYGLGEMVRKRVRAGRVQWDLPMLACIPEPFLLAASVLVLRWQADLQATATLAASGIACIGATLSLLGFLVSQWAFYSYRTVGAGHYIDPEHEVITSGAYGVVRHPLYLGAYLIWAGLALAFQSWIALALLLVYVAPAYVAYMRSEEAMLLSNLGEAYESYRLRVPMLFPRIARHAVE
jgi:protein-S-isoprenylcysteine O-methyltransferase Ste14